MKQFLERETREKNAKEREILVFAFFRETFASFAFKKSALSACK
jgi:hypothetical protein